MAILVRVRDLREKRGWTQGELAERAGVTRATINRLERAIEERPASMDYSVLERLCETFGVQPGELLLWEPEGAKRRRGV